MSVYTKKNIYSHRGSLASIACSVSLNLGHGEQGGPMSHAEGGLKLEKLSLVLIASSRGLCDQSFWVKEDEDP